MENQLTDRRMNRRSFVKGASAAIGVATLPSVVEGGICNPSEESRYEFCAFIKYIQDLTHEELAITLKQIGFDGAEVTVRKGGYITPESVADELPKLAEVFQKHDLKINILTTDIVDLESPNAESILKTAGSLGVQRYRMGFLRYDIKKPVLPQLELFGRQIKELAVLNRENGISGVYQNHAGAKYVGASFWDLLQLLRGIPVEEVGCIFDIRHAVVEGSDVWKVYYDIIKPHISALSAKDFHWVLKKEKDKRLSPMHCPLGDGQVDYQKFLKQFKADFQNSLVTLHVEYLEEAGVEANVAALKKDFSVLKNAMGV